MKKIVENFDVPGVVDQNGGGAFVPDPVETGDVYANRNNTDQTADTDTAVNDVPGVGEVSVSRAETLKALLMKLSTLPADVLDKIANEMSEDGDLSADPASAIDGSTQGYNLSTVATNEDVNEIFAGEELTEEFKTKTALVFEAALGARLVVLEAQLQEQYEVKIQESIEQVTEEIVNQIDKYLSFTAEQFIDENKVVLEATVKSTLAEEFMNGVFDLARKFNVSLPESEVDVVEALTNQINELETKLNEGLEKEIALTNEVKSYKKNEVFDSLSEGLTLTQKERLRTLSENVEVSDVEDYKSKVGILKESVVASNKDPKKVITETLHHNGIPLMEEVSDEVVINDPEMNSIVAKLKSFR